MRAKELKQLILTVIKSGIRRAIHIEGSPGLGKTEIPRQTAREIGEGFGFAVIHAPLLEPADYGFPVISADKTDVRFVVSKEKFPIEGSAFPERGLFLIDELAQADSNAQKVLRNLILEREIHGQRLKEGWTIVTTGNRAQDRAGANRLLSHMSNVLTRVTLDASVDDWVAWALQADVHIDVISFIRFRPAALNTFDPQAEVNATPRSWTQGISPLMEVIPAGLEFETFKGIVGEAQAGEFLSFLKVKRELPTREEILSAPQTARVPDADKPSAQYAAIGMVVFMVNKKNVAQVLTYVSRFPAEFQRLFLKDAIVRTPEIQETREFITWASVQK